MPDRGRLFFKPRQGILPRSVSGAEQADRAADQIVVKHVGGVELTVQLGDALVAVHRLRQRAEQVGKAQRSSDKTDTFRDHFASGRVGGTIPIIT